METRERATDLGVIAAVVSSLRNRPVTGRTVIVGEVGLSGELRRVKKLRERITEAEKLGYKRVIVPAVSKPPTRKKIDVVPTETVEQAMDTLMLR